MMATRLRKTRKNRGSRYCGWGQVAQHRASGHKGGLGVSGQMKHHYSSMLKDNPDHFGHSSTRPPHPNVTRKWAGVRDLDDLFAAFGAEQSDGKNVVDLAAHGIDKLLGGGSVTRAYTVRVGRSTESARRKVGDAGGEVVSTASNDAAAAAGSVTPSAGTGSGDDDDGSGTDTATGGTGDNQGEEDP